MLGCAKSGRKERVDNAKLYFVGFFNIKRFKKLAALDLQKLYWYLIIHSLSKKTSLNPNNIPWCLAEAYGSSVLIYVVRDENQKLNKKIKLWNENKDTTLFRQIAYKENIVLLTST